MEEQSPAWEQQQDEPAHEHGVDSLHGALQLASELQLHALPPQVQLLQSSEEEQFPDAEQPQLLPPQLQLSRYPPQLVLDPEQPK